MVLARPRLGKFPIDRNNIRRAMQKFLRPMVSASRRLGKFHIVLGVAPIVRYKFHRALQIFPRRMAPACGRLGKSHKGGEVAPIPL
jgi:hypothetical protein